jgi:hypothetical protein
MESNTFARTSARRYWIVDAEMFFCKKLDLINILEKICVSVYYLKDYNISYLKT